MNYENTLNLGECETWMKFYEEIMKLKEQTVSFIKKVKSEGKTIIGYAASTKGNTILNVFGLDCSMIDAIADRNPLKWGLKAVGSNIPIISEEEMRKKHPDYLFVLAWGFIKEFTERESEYLQRGGKMIVTSPRFLIIEK